MLLFSTFHDYDDDDGDITQGKEEQKFPGGEGSSLTALNNDIFIPHT